MSTALTRGVARLLLAPIVVVGAALLVKGYVDVGDGFAAGLVVALGVLLQYLAFGRSAVERALPLRHAPRLAVGGLLLAVAVAVVPALGGASLLEHAPGAGAEVVRIGSLELITAVAFDIGVFALVLGVAVTVLHLLVSEGTGEEAP